MTQTPLSWILLKVTLVIHLYESQKLKEETLTRPHRGLIKLPGWPQRCVWGHRTRFRWPHCCCWLTAVWHSVVAKFCWTFRRRLCGRAPHLCIKGKIPLSSYRCQDVVKKAQSEQELGSDLLTSRDCKMHHNLILWWCGRDLSMNTFITQLRESVVLFFGDTKVSEQTATDFSLKLHQLCMKKGCSLHQHDSLWKHIFGSMQLISCPREVRGKDVVGNGQELWERRCCLHSRTMNLLIRKIYFFSSKDCWGPCDAVKGSRGWQNFDQGKFFPLEVQTDGSRCIIFNRPYGLALNNFMWGVFGTATRSQ